MLAETYVLLKEEDCIILNLNEENKAIFIVHRHVTLEILNFEICWKNIILQVTK